ncbi:hypothetical protein [Carboxylicivirga marina]|uniref:DUF1735 domain-containing protein n=1 Tax=Carboxylicivirga marina TaxID=2800988 RepID=A0ABS1HID5_9BACT|nr:hypothetical protein [Carboxylicivirga marina]MBK3517385.1 hypothetical protein [Carboxylicivirga marina]
MKKIILPILLLMGVLVGCDQDVEGPLFDAEGVDYVAVGTTFVDGAYALNGDNEYSIMFPIHRTDKNAAGTVANLELTEGTGVFELETAQLSFTDGEGMAYAIVKPTDASLIDPATIYSFTLKVTGDNASPLYNTAEFSGQLELTLVSMGDGHFTSDFWPGDWPQEILKADGLDIYSLPGLYEEGSDILVIEDVTAGTVSIPNQKVWYHSAGYQVFVVGSGTVSTNGEGKKVFSMSLEHYIPDVHSWGAWPEVLVFP